MPSAETQPPQPPSSPKIPKTVWVLGFVSLLMDVSSEMIHAVLPLFMAETLGASTVWIGLTEGLGEGAALLTKVVSGALADRFGHKKLLVFLGYALGVISKPLFAVAGSLPVVLAARVGDRIGKGLRGAPRDALVADVTPEAVRGAAYGLRQSLDAVGAFVGPLLATGLLLFWTDDFRTIFWFALIPGVLCLLLILFGVEERAATEKPVSYEAETKSQPESAGSAASMRQNLPGVLREPAFRAVVLWGCLLSIARFSNAFLVLRAADAGLAAAWVPMLVVGMNLTFSAASYPFGRLADRMPANRVLTIGVLLLALSNLVLAFADGVAGVVFGIVLMGLHLGATQGVLSARVAKVAPKKSRAGAFGLYSFFCGLSALASGLLAGCLWDAFGPTVAFTAAAAVSILAPAILRPARATPTHE